MTESELSQYCREKGLFPEQIQSGRSECMQGFKSSKEQEAEAKKLAKADKLEIKELKKDLRLKEKALAETAALLVLRKKLRAFTGKSQRTTNLNLSKEERDAIIEVCNRSEFASLP